MARFIAIGSEQGETIAACADERAGRARGLVWALERRTVLVLTVLAILGVGLRGGGIDEIGFAEDEINKLEAVRAYERGQIAPNAEHPMMMKTLIFLSVGAARKWNAQAPPAVARISDEAAVRFPNILFGALTIFPLFLLTAAFFGRRTALMAAALWAFGINAITYNRIAKEDTLLVFFMLFAFYFYLRAKQTSGYEALNKRRHYILSAVSFGLMFASKYFPHYFGLNMLYHHLVHVRARGAGEPRGKTPSVFYVVVAVAFLVFNPAVLLPETWHYLQAYSSEKLLTHTGYLMGEQLYNNKMSGTPFGGTPVYFYLLFLLIKVPLPILAALVAGLFVVIRRRKEPGHAFLLLMFVLWIVPYSLVGAKWLRYTLSLMPLIYMIGAIGTAALVRGCESTARHVRLPAALLIVRVAAGIIFFISPLWIAFANMPHYALYTNAIARDRAGYFFPHDEFYDDGLREAIRYVCEHAPPGAIVAHETPGVASYYFEKYGRTDLRSRVISDANFNAVDETSPIFIILQRGRTYFENRAEMDAVRADHRSLPESESAGKSKVISPPEVVFIKVYGVLIRGVSAVEVYVKA